MRQIEGFRLWIGNVHDVRDMTQSLAAGVEVVIDVACDDPAIDVPRSLIFCRFPLHDGPENPAWMLRAAVTTTALFIRQDRPIMVACSAGMSRSVSVVAGALALVTGRRPDRCMEDVKKDASTAVSPGLWRQIQSVLE
jgi:protein-tyrosine phosphatase